MCGGFVGDFINNTLGSAGDFVENTVSSAGDYVGNQLQEIADDPLKAATKAALIYTGNAWALPIVEGVDTIEEGGTLEEGLLSAGKAYVGQQIGAEFGSQFGGGGYGTGEDFNMGEGGYYTGEDFNMGDSGDFYSGGDFIQDRPLTPEELEAAGIRDGAPIRDESREVTLTPGGNAVPANTLPSEMAAIDAEIAAAAKALPSSISPMQALRGLRSASSLLGGQQQQQMPQQQMMIGGRQPNQYGGVDYSGLLSLLTPRMVSRNSLLG